MKLPWATKKELERLTGLFRALEQDQGQLRAGIRSMSTIARRYLRNPVHVYAGLECLLVLDTGIFMCRVVNMTTVSAMIVRDGNDYVMRADIRDLYAIPTINTTER